MRPLGINKSFHVVLNNLTLADAEYLTDQKKKNKQLSSLAPSAFQIIHFTAYLLMDTRHFINTCIKSNFLQPCDFFIFSHIFAHSAAQIVLAYTRRESKHLAFLSPTPLCLFKDDLCIQLSCSMKIITQGDTKHTQNLL